MTVLQIIPRTSNTQGKPYILVSLVFIVGVAFIRSVYEEFRRYQSELQQNTSQVTVLRDYQPTKMQSWQLRPGDVLVLQYGQVVKADMVGVSGQSALLIQTSQLDGQSNLKQRKLLNIRTNLTLVINQPNHNLYSFQAFNKLTQEKISHNFFVPRGAKICTPGTTLGLVVYTGHECKQYLTSQKGSIKFSILDHKLGKILYILLGTMIAICILMTILQRFLLKQIQNKDQSQYFLNFFVWILLFSRLVPPSLMVSIEIIKVGQSFLFAYDKYLRTQFNQFHTNCANSPILQNLGLIQVVLTDKTGTLTMNQMKVAQMQSVGDSRVFGVCCSVCHSVIVLEEGRLQGSSGEQVATLQHLRLQGWNFKGKNKQQVLQIQIEGETLKFQMLARLEYKSERKSMSVIVRWGTRLLLLTKGADDFFIAKEQRKYLYKFMDMSQNSAELAKKGLRSLVFACRQLSIQQFQCFQKKLQIAESQQIVWESICHSYLPLGSVHFQDLIQPDVNQTISKLRQAGMAVWMLTGDKLQTAIEIGKITGLIRTDETSEPNYITIQGSKLATLTKEQLLQFVKSSEGKSVVAARISPGQKNQICKLVSSLYTVLAIGDGSNDVGMIRSAHVGVGVKGRQNNEALQSCDIQVGSFRQLQQLLLIYGRQILRKNSQTCQYILFKNYVLQLPIFYYAFKSDISGNSIYNDLNAQLYAIFYTAAPIVLFALFDFTCPRHVALNNPKLYRKGPQGSVFNGWFFLLDMGLALGVSAFLLEMVLQIYKFNPSGLVYSGRTVYNVLYFLIVLYCNLKILTISRTFSWLLLFVVLAPNLAYFLVLFLLDKWFGEPSIMQALGDMNMLVSIVLGGVSLFQLQRMLVSELREERETESESEVQ